MDKPANSIARDIASPAVKMGNRSLCPGVAVPPAFFGTFFRFERKYVPLRGGSPTVRAGVGASIPRSRRVNPPESVSFRQSWRTLMLTVGFPLAPCSPLDRLPVQINNPMELQVPPRAVVGASAPRLGNASGKVDVHRHRQGFFLGANNRRGLHCRVLRSLLI